MDLHDQKTARMILIGLCAVGLFSVYFGTKLLPITYRARAARIGELRERQGVLEAELQRARGTVARLGALEVELAQAEARWERARKLLPEESQIAELLRDVTRRGQKCGVDFVLFKPMPPAPQQEFTERPVEIKVEGGYHQIARFLSEISRMERIVHVRDLDVEQAARHDDEEGAPAGARLIASAYVLGGQAAPAPPPAQGAPGGGGTRVAAGAPAERVQGRAGSPAQGGSDE
ncbi:MAG: type 4a pilus biogenesis protein PilO [Candidatus Eisenbacteria bacterium]|uniref:Type 4a pilus biogenesis protein PilO n=1 Tax=Eiseniibacteriota bacterium TaxID=2212470 RepID=A0A937X9K3_UNCEI|nr:type 4a pilus biogenesis protein PilO [Candidatus Eisenbacteria bacterium]